LPNFSFKEILLQHVFAIGLKRTDLTNEGKEPNWFLKILYLLVLDSLPAYLGRTGADEMSPCPNIRCNDKPES